MVDIIFLFSVYRRGHGLQIKRVAMGRFEHPTIRVAGRTRFERLEASAVRTARQDAKFLTTLVVVIIIIARRGGSRTNPNAKIGIVPTNLPRRIGRLKVGTGPLTRIHAPGFRVGTEQDIGMGPRRNPHRAGTVMEFHQAPHRPAAPIVHHAQVV